MPTAPSLNNPPRLIRGLRGDPSTRNIGFGTGLAAPGRIISGRREGGEGWNTGTPFARPPTPRQTPTGGAFPNQLFGAALGKAVRGGSGPWDQSGFAPRASGGAAIGPPPQQGPIGAPPAQRSPIGAPPTQRPPIGAPPRGGGIPPGDLHSDPTGQAAGAPPGLPNTSPPAFSIPLVPADEAAKAEAGVTYTGDTANAMEAIRNSAMGWGDPAVMQQWGLPSQVNPNSALALAALRATQQQEAATNARNQAGTLFSSLAQGDRAKIGAGQQRADLAGYGKYQSALANFNRAMVAAAENRDRAINAANLDERQSALNNLPTAATTGSGGFGPGPTNITSRTPRPAPVKSGGKVPTLKSTPGPRTTKAGRGGRGGTVKVGKGRAPTRVKTGTRRISGRSRG